MAGVLADGRALIAVADGMGGHNAGEVASQSSLESVLAALKAGKTLEDAVATANTDVYTAARRNAEWTGMGTTLVALLRDNGSYRIINVGDSRAYRITEAGVEQITTDHTLRAEAESAGGQTIEHPRWRNALTRAIGTDPQIEADVFGPFDTGLPHVVVLCSDGLYSCVSSDAMRRIVAAASDPQNAARLLAEEALRNGSKDNITVAVVVFAAGLRPASQSRIRQAARTREWSATAQLWPNWRRQADHAAGSGRGHYHRQRLIRRFELGLLVVLLLIVVVLLARTT